MSDHLLAVAAQLDGEPDCSCVGTDRGTDTLGCPMHDAPAHDVTITGRESFAVEDGRLVYRARCSCGWFGWAVFDRDNARRQRDRHLEAALDIEPSAWMARLRRRAS